MNQQDYDVYVNNIHGQRFMEEDGGNLDVDYTDFVYDGPGSSLLSEKAETISYPSPNGGVYRIGASYYGHLLGGYEDPREINVETYIGESSLTPTDAHTLILHGWGCLWNIATVRINAGTLTGWYEVDESGRRVMADQRWELSSGVFPRYPCGYKSYPYSGEMDDEGFDWNTANVALSGPNGTGTVILLAGKSAQFTMTGDIALYWEDAQGVHEWDEGRTVYGYFSVANLSPGGEGGAWIDDFGVFSAISSGCYRVQAPVEVLELEDGQGGYYYTNNQPSIEVRVIDQPKVAMDYNRDGSISTAEVERAEVMHISWVSENGSTNLDYGGWSPAIPVAVNADDDDHDGLSDLLATNAVSGEDDLLAIEIPMGQSLFDAHVTLSASSTNGGAIRLWSDPEKSPATEETLPTVWNLRLDALTGTPFYVEGLQQGLVTLRLECDAAGSSGPEFVREYVLAVGLNVDLIPDFNHDRVIDATDKSLLTTNGPYRFWVNDDDDYPNSEVDGNDAPGREHPDASDNQLDGMRDLVDFFPVFIDLKPTLDILDASNYKFYLTSQDAGALHVFVDANLTPANVDQYLVGTSVTTRLLWDMTSWSPVNTIGTSGIRLSTNYLNRVKNDGMGVVLLEATRPTTNPLCLKILDLEDKEVYRRELPLSISSVTNMFRYLNLRSVSGDATGGGLSHTNEPANGPDALSNGKNVVFIHGFNESADEGLGNIAETFKRLYWSGSKAKYTGVAWYGNEGYYGIDQNLRYHADVINAFQTASNFAGYVSTLTGEIQIAAYSLGNMVVSSAIEDWGLQPSKYYMIHAAMALEAYDASERAPNMIENRWVCYTNKLYASEWHTLWDDSPEDGRHSLTWRGRFADVVNENMYNFYSSEDEVLDNCTNQFTPGQTFLEHLFNWNFNFRRYAWACQELYKGRYVEWLGGSLYGGWGVTASTNYMTNNVLFAADRAALITDSELKGVPFFDGDPPVPVILADPTNAIGPGSIYATTNRNTLLADMIPAISVAAGRNPLDVLVEPNDDRNFDMNSIKPNGWPAARYVSNPLPGHGQYPWYHGDYRAVAYLYTFNLFDKISKDIGGLIH